jgi:acetyl-CoA carboxylase biotin carboxyl carrier protein
VVEARAADAVDAQPQDNSLDHERLAGLVHAFISMMNAGRIARLDLDYQDLRISLRAHGDHAAPATVVQHVSTPQMVVESASIAQPDSSGQHVIAAPMIGTFYTAPAPNEPPFIKPGDRVEEGQTVGIIEAMKIMNEIAADRAGTVVEIVARNAQPVEFGSPLVTLANDDQ